MKWASKQPGLENATTTSALAELLETLWSDCESWWSPHTWRDNRRSGDRWQAASALVVDVDYHDGTGVHAAHTLEQRATLELAATTGRLPGNLFHITPRGARFVFVPPEPITVRELYADAIEGACVVTHCARVRARGNTS